MLPHRTVKLEGNEQLCTRAPVGSSSLTDSSTNFIVNVGAVGAGVVGALVGLPGLGEAVGDAERVGAGVGVAALISTEPDCTSATTVRTGRVITTAGVVLVAGTAVAEQGRTLPSPA
jgi:hypothetical protein